ncbi:teichoic acid biosynthesis protein F [Paenibacillus antibioticophila]|uniref:Teichoic acid biosynthesis protein F n=1 Tax=Paenibacillus antibioticophila TaxID=1274374 RepID=A0A920CFY7_9BACL|nr:CDP-glycerol glycerophosphotransferase family protein [Paenibacillus antibioticophila]GIO35157.1 teichoic acid biosynthesis protein F [Paenibacillus antibioticophila]
MMKLVRLIGSLILLPLYWFSYFVPRNPKLWVFGSWFGKRYSDSSRYVYEYVNKHEKDIRAIWLTRDPNITKHLRSQGYEAYHVSSLKGYWYTCRAGAALFTVNITDINTLGASKLLKFQLWHGIPLKKVVYDDVYHLPEQHGSFIRQKLLKLKKLLLPFKDVYGKWDLVASTSPAVSTIFRSAFRLSEEYIPITGSPRGDIILDSSTSKPSIIQDILTDGEGGITKRIAYFPTHRIHTEELSRFINSLETSGVPEFLEDQQAVLYIKLHYYNLEQHNHAIRPKRIVLLQEHEVPDINYLLPWIDILITDYSSVFYDYLLLKRPIIFTPYDLSEYLTHDRELYGNYEQLTPGPKCGTWEEVLTELTKLFSGQDIFFQQRKAMLEQYHTYSDTQNSKRVTQKLRSLLK